MGADGGMKITKVTDIKDDWLNIKRNLIKAFEREVHNSGAWMLKYNKEYLQKSKELPNNIHDLTNEKIIKLLLYLRSCDCPKLYEDSIITADGDNVADQMNTLSWCLSGEYIELWT